MKKIPTIFDRDWDAKPSLVIDEPILGCEWVFNDEGIATRKYDGMCCLISAGKLFKRRELKNGTEAPKGWRPVQFEAATGNEIGWEPVSDTEPQDKYFRLGFENYKKDLEERGEELESGTYELIGPSVQGNIEQYPTNMLIRHDTIHEEPDVPRTYDGLKKYFTSHNAIEGIVWHHEDGRMAKVKAKDFGLRRK